MIPTYSRGPRGEDDVRACIELFRHSSYWRDSYQIKEDDMVNTWLDLLRSGIGHIDIYQTNSHFTKLAGLTSESKSKIHPSYKLGFIAVFFMCFITLEFSRLLVTGLDEEEKDIDDIIMLFMKRSIDYRNDKSCPNPVIEPGSRKENKIIGRVAESEQYFLIFGIWHPGIVRFLRDYPYLNSTGSERVKKSNEIQFFGYQFNAFFSIVDNGHLMKSYEKFGLRFLRGYNDDDNLSEDSKRYIFCRTLNQHVSDFIRIPENINTAYDYDDQYFGRSMFYTGKREAGLGLLEQYVAQLVLQGYDRKDICTLLYDDINVEDRESLKKGVGRIQTKLGDIIEKLSAKGYVNHTYTGKEKTLKQALENGALHEIREFIFPFYEWPSDLVRR